MQSRQWTDASMSSFRGGNANPLGGFTFLKNIALKWSGVIIAKLMICPPSYGVAKAVIEGLLMNRLIGRVVVNIPPDSQLSSIEASVARTYRVVFALPYHTPRECVFWVVGVASLLNQVLAVAIVDFLKALCSRGALLRESLWQHWSQVALHRLDKDVLRLKEIMSRANLQFVWNLVPLTLVQPVSSEKPYMRNLT